jgi:hypothetical protein
LQRPAICGDQQFASTSNLRRPSFTDEDNNFLFTKKMKNNVKSHNKLAICDRPVICINRQFTDEDDNYLFTKKLKNNVKLHNKLAICGDQQFASTIIHGQGRQFLVYKKIEK